MADSLTLAQLPANELRTLARRFNRRVAEIVILLFNHKSADLFEVHHVLTTINFRAGSLGALAGFAIAILFIRKISNSPGRKKRLQKDAGSSSPSTTAFLPNEVASSYKNCEEIKHAKAAGATSDFHSPAYLAFGQIVRQRFYGSKKMICKLLGVILMESNPEELQHATVRSSSVELLLEIITLPMLHLGTVYHCSVAYAISRILLVSIMHVIYLGDAVTLERAMTALECAGLFKTGSLTKRFYFVAWRMASWSFVQQIEPKWHVDTNAEVLSKLSRFIRYPSSHIVHQKQFCFWVQHCQLNEFGVLFY